MRWYLLVFIVLAVEIYLQAAAAPKNHVQRLAKRSSFTPAQRQFQKLMQEAHNTKRKQHCAPALTIDDSICNSAQAWADKIAAKDVFEHSYSDTYGENIAYYYSSSSSDPVTIDSAMKGWYDDEVGKYNFNSPDSVNYDQVGHFTQLVWKDSTSFCCGYGRASKSGKVYEVCQFFPAGNYEGENGANVFPKGSC